MNDFLLIPFIHAGDDCDDCKQALELIETAIEKCSDIPCKIDQIDSTRNKAFVIAIENGINTLPGFVIGETTFNGNNYTEDEIMKAIRETWTQINQ